MPSAQQPPQPHRQGIQDYMTISTTMQYDLYNAVSKIALRSKRSFAEILREALQRVVDEEAAKEAQDG